MGARQSRRQQHQNIQSSSTCPTGPVGRRSAPQSGANVVAEDQPSTSSEGQEGSNGANNSNLVITICMLKMEPSQEEEPQQEVSSPESTVPPAAAAAATSASSSSHQAKCGCYENNNCSLGLTATTPTISASGGSTFRGSRSNSFTSSVPAAGAKCGCNCSKTDSVNNNEPPAALPTPQSASAAASANDYANNNNNANSSTSSEAALISDLLSNHHHLLHHHHHHHHHHLPSWATSPGTFLAVATTTSAPPTSGAATTTMSNNASVLNRTMQQHQQQLRQQLLASATSGGSATASETGPVSPSLMVTASAVCEMSDKLSDLKLARNGDTDQQHQHHHGEEHPFSVGECPRCAVASQQGAGRTAAAVEEKILNTTPGSETKESTTAVATATTMAKVVAGPGTTTMTNPKQSATCCRQPNPTGTTSTLLSSLTSSGKKSRACKCCRSTNCANNNNNNSTSQSQATSGSSSNSSSGKVNPVATTVTSSSATGAKSKKGNWGLKFNCAKLRGTKSSGQTAAAAAASSSTASTSVGTGATSSGVSVAGSAATSSMANGSSSAATAAATSSIIGGASGRLLRSESEKVDSCVCTAYRKVDDIPAAASAAISSGNGYPLSASSLAMMPHHHAALHHHHHHLETAASSNGPGGGGGGVASNQQPQNHAFLFPPATGHHDMHHGHHHPGTTTTTTIIHRIDGSAAQALYGSLGAGGHHGGNSVIVVSGAGMFDISRFNSSDDFSLEDCDERARLQRELEIREGVDAPPNFTPRALMSGGTLTGGTALGAVGGAGVVSQPNGTPTNHQIAFVCSPDTSSALSLLQRGLLLPNNHLIHAEEMPRVHSQVDFIHCLVPDLQKITSCCFYWGKMDRYEAEKLLDGKPEGTFLLRDSAQEEFLFSVSFRKYSRSLHARIEQFNHKFSFDSRDPGVYTASTVTGLLEHYKDPSCVMFFEPMLTYPLNRNFCFSLQQLCRATIVSNTTYDGINELTLPKSLKSYLKEYHYRQRVRFRPLDEHLYSGI